MNTTAAHRGARNLQRIKTALQRFLYPLGSVATVRGGPLKGGKYRITEQSGWGPVLGRWEPEAQRAYGHLVAKSELVWDLGANTGLHSLLFSRLVGAAGKVVAYEPLPINVEEILDTRRLNGATNIEVVSKAVSDVAGQAQFHIGRHHKQGSLVGAAGARGPVVQVECMTLDQALAQSGPPDFVKIDIEGAESRALRGFTRVTESYPTFAIDLHTPEEDVAVGNWLSGHGYRVFRLVDVVARAAGVRDRILEPIVELGKGWPDKGGMWGTVVAAHPTRTRKVAILEELSTGGRSCSP